MSGISVTGGTIGYSKMILKMDPKEYAKTKVHIWLMMLNEGQRPTKWTKPNKNGTNVHFKMINSQEEYNEGLDELGVYIKEVNKEFGFDFSLEKDEKGNENGTSTK